MRSPVVRVRKTNVAANMRTAEGLMLSGMHAKIPLIIKVLEAS